MAVIVIVRVAGRGNTHPMFYSRPNIEPLGWDLVDLPTPNGSKNFDGLHRIIARSTSGSAADGLLLSEAKLALQPIPIWRRY